MSERRTRAEMSNLVRDAVGFRGLDDDARDVARLISIQFRDRLRQAQAAAGTAAGAAGVAAGAAGGAAGAATPVARRVGRDAARRARPAARRGSAVAVSAASEVIRRARPIAHEAAPVARRAGEEAATAARRAGDEAATVARRAGDDAAEAIRRAGDEAATAVQSFADSRAGRTALAGAAAGAIGSIVMGGAMLAAKRAGFMTRVPPKEVTEKGAKKAAKRARKKARQERDAGSADDGQSASPSRAAEASRSVENAPSEAFDVAASVLHVGFGTALGAAFGLAYSQLPREWRAPLPTFGEAVGFATLVWAASYGGWVPALGLMPPVTEDDRTRQATMIAAHWIFGAVLGAGVLAAVREE